MDVCPASCHFCGEENPDNLHKVHGKYQILGCWTCGREIWSDGKLNERKDQLTIHEMLSHTKEKNTNE